MRQSLTQDASFAYWISEQIDSVAGRVSAKPASVPCIFTENSMMIRRGSEAAQ